MTPWAEAMNARQAAGLCRLCGEPQAPGRALCERHLAEQRERRLKNYYARKAAGECVEQGCGRKPPAGQIRCKTCAAKIRAYHTARRRAAKKAPGA